VACLLLLFVALASTGCQTLAPAPLTCTSMGNACYDSNGAEKTAIYDLDTTTRAVQLTLKRMGFKLGEHPREERGERKIKAAADKMTITVTLKKVSPRSTKMKVAASDDTGGMDIATALEIIFQTEKTAELLTKRKGADL